MSANVIILWAHPTQRTDGTALGAFEVQIGQRAAGDTGDFTPVGAKAHDETARLDLPNVPGGEWEFRLTVHADGKESVPVDANVTVPFSAPNPVSSVEISVTP